MRKTSLELLRIVSMMLIILHHFSVHGVWPDAGPFSSVAAVRLLAFGGKLGVDVFVIISGYFVWRRRFKIRSIVRIVLQTWFYSWVFLLAAAIMGQQPSIQSVLKGLFPVISGEYWFVTCYIATMFLSPFVNRLLTSLSSSGHALLVGVSFVLLSVVPTFSTFNPIATNLPWFIFLYALGGLMARRDNLLGPFNPVAWACRLGGGFKCFFLCVAFIFGSIVLISLLNRLYSFSFLSPSYFLAQNQVPVVLASIGLFQGFNGLEMRASSFINSVAKTALGVYLIHDNPFVRMLLWPYFLPLYQYGWVAIMAGSIVASVAVFAICSCIDFLRIKLIEPSVMDAVDRLYGDGIKRLDETFDGIMLQPAEGEQ